MAPILGRLNRPNIPFLDDDPSVLDSAPMATMSMPGLKPMLPEPEHPQVTAALTPLQQREQNVQSDLAQRMAPKAPATGVLGKVGRVASTVGNILGDVFAPGPTSLIKGSDLYNERIMARDKSDLDQISQEKSAESQREAQAATTEYTKQRPAIEQAKILQKLTTSLAPKGIIATMNPDGTIDTQDDPDSAAYHSRIVDDGLKAARAEREQVLSQMGQPGSPLYEQKQHQLQEIDKRIGIAEQALGLRGAEVGISRERLSFQEDKHYNPQPTPQERNKGDMANSAADQIADMKDIVLKHPQYFGPGYGQSQAFKKWIGSQDPDAQRFLSAQTIAADHLAATFGGRSDAALTALHNALGNFRDNPKAAQAALDQLTKANTVFQQAGKTHNRAGELQHQQSDQPLGETTKPDGVYEMNGQHYRVQGGKVYAH